MAILTSGAVLAVSNSMLHDDDLGFLASQTRGSVIRQRAASRRTLARSGWKMFENISNDQHSDVDQRPVTFAHVLMKISWNQAL